MRFSIEIKKLFGKKLNISMHSGQLAVVNRGDKDLAGKLMALALSKGCSVIVYGGDVDYYRYIKDVEPQYIGTIDNMTLLQDYKAPFLKGTKDRAETLIRKCFSDYDLDGKYLYLNRKSTGMQIEDPNLYKSYIQIKRGNTSKDRVVTEALLVNILSTCLYADTLHELVLFIEGPFKPVTETALVVLTEVAKSSRLINVVLMYNGMDCDTEENAMYSEDGKIFIKSRNWTFEVKNGEISKEI